jgi:hypothetical protein
LGLRGFVGGDEDREAAFGVEVDDLEGEWVVAGWLSLSDPWSRDGAGGCGL